MIGARPSSEPILPPPSPILFPFPECGQALKEGCGRGQVCSEVALCTEARGAQRMGAGLLDLEAALRPHSGAGHAGEKLLSGAWE